MEKSFENVVPPKRTEQVSWAKIDKGTVPGAVRAMARTTTETSSLFAKV
jgi:hypothetical protein